MTSSSIRSNQPRGLTPSRITRSAPSVLRPGGWGSFTPGSSRRPARGDQNDLQSVVHNATVIADARGQGERSSTPLPPAPRGVDLCHRAGQWHGRLAVPRGTADDPYRSVDRQCRRLHHCLLDRVRDRTRFGGADHAGADRLFVLASSGCWSRSQPCSASSAPP